MSADLKRALKKFLPHLLQGKADNLNEADTLQRIIKVFEDVLGYSTLSEITRESAIKDKFVDLAIKIDGTIRILVEAKAADVILRDRHIEQAERYAAEGNHKWVVLTNGTAWNLYHLTFDEGIEYEKLFSIDLCSEDAIDAHADCLALLHRQSVKKGRLDGHWAERAALSPVSVAKILFSEELLRMIRRDIRRREGISIDEEDIATAVHEMMSTEAREIMGPMKIRRKRKTVKRVGPEPPGV
jgi:predicted type IV restriction endonuclease